MENFFLYIFLYEVLYNNFITLEHFTQMNTVYADSIHGVLYRDIKYKAKYQGQRSRGAAGETHLYTQFRKMSLKIRKMNSVDEGEDLSSPIRSRNSTGKEPFLPDTLVF